MATELQALRSKLEILSSTCSLLSAQLQELTNDVNALTETKSDDASTCTGITDRQFILSRLLDSDPVIQNFRQTQPIRFATLMRHMGLKRREIVHNGHPYFVWVPSK